MRWKVILTDCVLPEGVGGRVAPLDYGPGPSGEIPSGLGPKIVRDHAVDRAHPDRKGGPVLQRVARARCCLVVLLRRRRHQSVDISKKYNLLVFFMRTKT